MNGNQHNDKIILSNYYDNNDLGIRAERNPIGRIYPSRRFSIFFDLPNPLHNYKIYLRYIKYSIYWR